MIATGIIISATGVNVDVVIIFISIEVNNSKALNRIRDILISYEIVCATPRNAPNNAYLEFDLHPARKVAYTFIAETHIKYRIPYCIQNEGFI